MAKASFQSGICLHLFFFSRLPGREKKPHLKNSPMAKNGLQLIIYLYDKVGNRTSMTDARGTHTYAYDELYRLTGVMYPEGRTQAWSYDEVGNRLWEVETLSGQDPDTTFYHYTTDRLDSTTGAVAQSYQYDANGSMTQRGAEVFRYDAKMRMREARVPGQPVNTMTYDPMGLRVQTVSSEGKIGYLIDPSSQAGQFNTMSVTAEYENGAKSREFGLGARPDEVLWEENGEGLFYLLYDGLGSVVAATNANGQVVAQMAYDAFGKVFSQSGQAQDVRYGYTGRPTDKDIGLQYNRARYYEAGVGRWNRADEWRGELMVPASLHRYVYVHQNPINAFDPSGFEREMPEWFSDFLVTYVDPLLIMLIGWVTSFKKAKDLDALFRLDNVARKSGIIGFVLFSLLSILLIANSSDRGICKATKAAITFFWSVVFFVLAAHLAPLFFPVGGIALVIVGWGFYNFITKRWIEGVDLALDCKKVECEI